jgi:5-methylcytosine-specific restriction endonuclease McrA
MNAEDIYKNKEYFITTTAEQREANGAEFWARLGAEIIQMKMRRSKSYASKKEIKRIKKDFTPKRVLKTKTVAKKIASLPVFVAPNINPIQANTNKCFYCREKRASSIDHIIPISKGGHKSASANRVTACPQCNNLKSDLSLESFRELLMVAAYSTRRKFANYGQGRFNNAMKATSELIKFRDNNLDLMLKESIINDSYERLKLGILRPIAGEYQDGG